MDHDTIQDVGVGAAVAFSSWSLALAWRADRRESQRLEIETARRQEELDSSRPQLRLVPDSFHVITSSMDTWQFVYVDARVNSEMPVFEVKLEARYGDERIDGDKANPTGIEFGTARQFKVTVPHTWTLSVQDYPPTYRAKPGMSVRIWDQRTGAEDTLTVK